MKIYQIMESEGSRYQMEVMAVRCGSDYSVTICGGSGYHVGASALGCARPLYENKPLRSATVSVLCAYEHKDDEAARWAAGYLATELHCRVSVAAGIHIDDAQTSELKILMEQCEKVCKRLVEEIKGDTEKICELEVSK